MKRLVLLACLSLPAAVAQTAASTTAPMTPSAIVTSDAASKTVRVNFTAGHGTHNNGLNYNGDAKGEKTLTVPLGWAVEVRLSNAGRLPHDFAVFTGTAVPANLGTARLAFANAAAPVTAPGGTAEPVKFAADRPGSYVILCRVGRHAQNGMYLKMTVANGIKAPSYR